VWEALRGLPDLVFEAPRDVDLKGIGEARTVYPVDLSAVC
jgi:hypothetical protein